MLRTVNRMEAVKSETQRQLPLSTGPNRHVGEGEGSIHGVVEAGLKIGDIDPRFDPSAINEISDKSLSVGGGVLEAVLVWLNESDR